MLAGWVDGQMDIGRRSYLHKAGRITQVCPLMTMFFLQTMLYFQVREENGCGIQGLGRG